MNKLRTFTLILISLFALILCYLTMIKPKKSVFLGMVDSFGFYSKIYDTLIINYPISEEEFRDILFTVYSFSDEYGGEAFLIDGIVTGESFLGRTFELKDSSLAYKTKEIRVGESFEDVQQYRSLWNIFETKTNKISFLNEGFVKTIKIWEFGDTQLIIELKKPVLLITGKIYDSSYINKSVMTFYKLLPFILIFLGLIYLVLSFSIRIKLKIKVE